MVSNHRPSEIRAVVFDCDGTLTDSLGSALASFHYALKCSGARPHTDAEVLSHFGASGDRILTRLLGNDPARGARAFNFFIQHQQSATLPLHTGIAELLETLTRQGLPLGIFTGRHARDLEVVLKPHGIRHLFKACVTDDLVERSKPAPDGLLLAASQLGVSPASIVYIGDTEADILAANAAGAFSAAALWDSNAPKNALLACNPRIILHEPKEFLNLLENSPDD